MGRASGLGELWAVLMMEQVAFFSLRLLCPQAQRGHVEASLLALSQSLLSVLMCSLNDHFWFHPLESSDN